VANVLGVVLGRHDLLVEARDADTGELRATGRVAHRAHSANEEDPTAWWRSLAAAIAQAGVGQVAALSVTGSHPGLVLLDGAGVVLRPVQAWDGARAEVARLRQALGAERWAARLGSVPDAGTAVTRLAWLRRTDPAAFARIGTVLLAHDWLTYRLAGRPVTDRGSASCTGLWSPSAEGWLREAIELLAGRGDADAWSEHLPAVLDPDQPADWLDAPVVELVGLRGRPLVAPGTAEPMAVALALALVPGQVGVALADGALALAPIETPLADPSGVVRSRADAAGGQLAVAQMPGGADLVSAIADLLQVDVAELGAAALETEPSVDEVVVVPGVDEGGAIVTGIGPGIHRGAMARATFEGVASAAVGSLEAITEAGARWDDGEPIYLTGPAEGLDAHAQVLANLGAHPVVAVPGHLAASGACVQAAAILARAHPSEVAAAWALADGWQYDPEDDPEREHRLAVHAEERDRQRRAWDQ
jgi:xylulokinase